MIWIKMKVMMILMQVLKVEKIKKNDADYGDENNRRKKL
jgi:hypothetical protein